MNVRKVTPIFIVESITPAAIAFWEKTGWKKHVEVPLGSGVGFVLLENDGRELMLQSRASVKDDLVGLETVPAHALYIDVDDLVAARAECQSAGGRVVIEERATPYGVRETWAIDPSGTLVGYAVHS